MAEQANQGKVSILEGTCINTKVEDSKGKA
jgi:hypothetical protein